MFLSACRQVAKDFPDVAYDEDLLDRVCLNVSLFLIALLNIIHNILADHSKSQAIL